MKVLIADDEFVSRKVLEQTLKGWGYEVVAVDNGQKAIQALRDRDVQLAILDWMMPEVNGIEVCRTLKGLARFVYVILLTGKRGREDITIAIEAGASDYLLKPVDPAELLPRLKVGERISTLHMHHAHLQKLESIGELAAGIAHEINTPTQYVGDNTRFLQDAFRDICSVLRSFDQLRSAASQGPVSPTLIQEIDEAIRKADLDYLLQEVPKAISQSLEGIDHVTKIVRAMKEFSHPGGGDKAAVNLNHAIETTLTVARNEWKYLADVEVDFDPDLPLVPCFPGELNQAILNIVVNAAHAIGDKVATGTLNKGVIRISTARCEDQVEIRIQDTGSGIPEEIRSKIFDPFFTTKPVGRGTGQGLALTHAIVVEKHGGSITVESEVGRGTTFILRLPAAPAAEGLEAQAA